MTWSERLRASQYATAQPTVSAQPTGTPDNINNRWTQRAPAAGLTFRLSDIGIVYVSGSINRGAGAITTDSVVYDAGALPAAFRPTAARQFTAAQPTPLSTTTAGINGVLAVQPDGSITLVDGKFTGVVYVSALYIL